MTLNNTRQMSKILTCNFQIEHCDNYASVVRVTDGDEKPVDAAVTGETDV